ncbi:MAG: phosphoribosyltransferase [Pseudomonadota bacterium]
MFRDRSDAGRQLAAKLDPYKWSNALVLALPRGGVPVAGEAAMHLGLPLDIMLVRKLGVPGHEEFAMGAIADGDVIIINENTVHGLRIGDEAIERVAAIARKELARRDAAYRAGRSAPSVKGRVVILVDDGIATGADMRAAVEAAKRQGASKVIVAVPVASQEAVDLLARFADEVVCVFIPDDFAGISWFYEDFHETRDAEVKRILDEAKLAFA